MALHLMGAAASPRTSANLMLALRAGSEPRDAHDRAKRADAGATAIRAAPSCWSRAPATSREPSARRAGTDRDRDEILQILTDVEGRVGQQRHRGERLRDPGARHRRCGFGAADQGWTRPRLGEELPSQPLDWQPRRGLRLK
jgi:hypothetical protein